MKLLIISYSQTGQLNELIENCTRGIDNVDIDRIEYQPQNDFPFPWTSDEFFDAMPESVLETKLELKPINYKHEKYDLIILGYQPWFLSPSIPTSSLLQEESFLARVKNTPVITIIGSRNMWINSQKSVSKRILEAGGEVVGNIPFIDTHNNYVSAFTILHWMLAGQKTKKWGIFPKPGVSSEDIEGAEVYAPIINKSIQEKDFSELQTEILKVGKISVGSGILFVETAGRRIFGIWSKLITRFGTSPKKRRFLIRLYKYYLVVALFFIAPIVVSIFRLLVLPFVYPLINKRKSYICSTKLT
ncbi:hypothetical protein J1N10_07535 [Carboxylicivirga sp. A043]|uniref:hypothetical protein n=1 Tax=Carboxylicivirga litoralis TaxID=2816963 RepID=UPI0021CAF03C|nr:hypothetical protein [Carboxylicivirga sp. A043]MCU4155825.1 hypothetical protein [Carboxylicivirga sp. A043]